MIPSFHSGFADDISAMMKWRGTIGYAEYCYSYHLADFDKYCQQKFPDSSILTWEIAISYLNSIKEHRDVRVDVIALRNLGKYQTKKGLMACIFPFSFFTYKKRRLPYIMTDDELSSFFSATDNYPCTGHNPLLTYTVATIFRLQYSTGMRPTEVRLLKREDFDFKSNTIYIADSKMHKDRRIVVNPLVMDMCKNYDVLARCIYPNTDVFFPNSHNKAYTSQSLADFFHKCWKVAGNPVVSSDRIYCSPYILRHNYATRKIMQWMEEGKDFEIFMPYLSTYMGHQTFSETCYYLHLLPERLSMTGCMDISKILSEV